MKQRKLSQGFELREKAANFHLQMKGEKFLFTNEGTLKITCYTVCYLKIIFFNKYLFLPTSPIK